MIDGRDFVGESAVTPDRSIGRRVVGKGEATRGSEPSIRGGQVAEIQGSREFRTRVVEVQKFGCSKSRSSEVVEGCEPFIWGGQVAEIEEISRTRELTG
jgi:hypothetical protein